LVHASAGTLIQLQDIDVRAGHGSAGAVWMAAGAGFSHYATIRVIPAISQKYLDPAILKKDNLEP